MAQGNNKDRRSRLGYGSSYRRGRQYEIGQHDEIPAVLGGQVWMVKPDNQAKAAHPCIWMQAGVAGFKSCNNYYDCTTCKYDLGMQQKTAKGKQASWQDAMRRRPDLERICRHSLTHRIESRICAYNYECAGCDFDQFFEDVLATRTKTVPFEIQDIRGFDLPVGYYFHNGHTWARIESGGYLRIGLDDFALKLFGRADGLDMPLMGKELDLGRAGWGLKRKGNHADVLSPVDGVIVEVNNDVRENPELANREPYGGGWLFMVRPPDIKASAKKLMADTDSVKWMKSEVDQLENLIEEVAGPLAADGGLLQEDIYGNLPDLGWDRLAKMFLKT